MSQLLHKAAKFLCPHGGTAQFFVLRHRVMVGGRPLLTASDSSAISGCTFQVANTPRPCVRVRFLHPATRVRSGGQAVVLRDSGGLCISAENIPQGKGQVVFSQSRVRGK
jgi:hypothetical protein